MEPSIEQRAVQLLRESRVPSVPVRALHSALAAEAGAAAGSYTRLIEEVRRRADVFVVLETEHPLGPDTGWPAGARSEYEAELSAVGVDIGPHVTLTRPSSGPDPCLSGDGPASVDVRDLPLQPLHDSLMRIWEIAASRPALRTAVAAALTGCHDLPRALGFEELTPAGVAPPPATRTGVEMDEAGRGPGRPFPS